MHLKVLAPITVDDDGVHCGECEHASVWGESPANYVVCNLFEETISGMFDTRAKARPDEERATRCDACLKGVRDE